MTLFDSLCRHMEWDATKEESVIGLKIKEFLFTTHGAFSVAAVWFELSLNQRRNHSTAALRIGGG